jgi:acyl-coenzyme A thioesterase PaaI-like protein
MGQAAIQDQLEQTLSYCWVCGRNNEHGLQIKSYWEGDDEAVVCQWQPEERYISYPGVVSGGILASLIDCHSVCTAIASTYKMEGREVDSVPAIWYTTTGLQVTYLRPVGVDLPVTLRAKVKERQGKKLVVTCSLYSKGKECVRAEISTRRIASSS